MAGQLKFKPFQPMKPPPGWKCPKRFKLGLGEPWESESESSSDGETDVEVRTKVRTFVSQQNTSKHSVAWLLTVKSLTAQVLKSRRRR